jgi:hypothetical protein
MTLSHSLHLSILPRSLTPLSLFISLLLIVFVIMAKALYLIGQ